MNLLNEALAYYDRGWNVFPAKPDSAGKKVPDLGKQKLTPFQSVRPTREDVQRLFSRDRQMIAVMLGEVSSKLICRDFDDMDAYSLWAGQFPDLAGMLPTVRTARGMHVYCNADISRLRKEIGKCFLDHPDGESRLYQVYTILPPSRHPSGFEYRWEVLPQKTIPTLDPSEIGFLQPWINATEKTDEDRDHRDYRRVLKKTDAVKGGLAGEIELTGELKEKIESAIVATCPHSYGHRERCLFEYARHLKAIPLLSEASALDVQSFVIMWWEIARPVIRTEPFGVTMRDFTRGWNRVKYPKGTGPLYDAFKRAMERPAPEFTAVYGVSELSLLASLCRELQGEAGQNPFFLPCRKAGELLNVDHSTANRWLGFLEDIGAIVTVVKGTLKSGRASRFHYLKEL
ncbi:MAG: bifunctional DNA primase/polymerase [Planctomycetaceae bacterium]|nr:bifunctional DNA primase/polymerase [Planctomycetaceae bacterium]